MTFSIRTRLTILISLIYLILFLAILITGGFVAYYSLQNEVDKKLSAEREYAKNLFEDDFRRLTRYTGKRQRELAENFAARLRALYHHKPQFVIFSIKTRSGRKILSDGGVRNVQLLLPKGFLSRHRGAYNQKLGDKHYRLALRHYRWGTLVVGLENQTFFEMVEEFSEILFIGFPLSFLLIFLVGRYLAKRVMRPVLSAATAAEDISVTNLQQRLPIYKGKDEFSVLVQTLNQMIAKIENGVQQIQQFTQDAAHELRTPLTLLRGELELLYQHKNLPGDLHEPLQKSLDRAIAMSRITENLLLLAQSDAGRYSLKKEPFDLSALLQEIVEDIRILVQNRPIEVNLVKCDSIEFYGDKDLIQRLLLNLADNAIKFTESGRIEFNLTRQQNRIEIIICDSGVGIPAEKLPYIFNRFFRANDSRTGSLSGSGLGLAICKWIVEAHQGEIALQSEVVGGTKVSILFEK